MEGVCQYVQVAEGQQWWQPREEAKGLATKSALGPNTHTPVLLCSRTTWQVVQPDKFTLALRLRTPLSHGWLHLSWHPTAARLCVGRPPARGDVSEGFTLAQQVRHNRASDDA